MECFQKIIKKHFYLYNSQTYWLLSEPAHSSWFHISHIMHWAYIFHLWKMEHYRICILHYLLITDWVLIFYSFTALKWDCVSFFVIVLGAIREMILFASILTNSMKKNRIEVNKIKLKVKIHFFESCKPHLCAIFNSHRKISQIL